MYFTPNAAEAGKSQKVYPAALVSNGDIYLGSSKGWTKYAGTFSEYATVTMATSYLPVFATATNTAGFKGIVLVLGYGTDANEMLSSKRYSVVYTFP